MGYLEITKKVEIEFTDDDVVEYIQEIAKPKELLMFKKLINEELYDNAPIEIFSKENSNLLDAKYNELFLNYRDKINPYELETLLDNYVNGKEIIKI